MADVQEIPRVKRNIQKMLDQGAPEVDIDAYVASEGFTPEVLSQAKPQPKLPEEELTIGEAVVEGVKNIPSSALAFGESIAQAVTSPIETAKAVGQVAVGGLQKGAQAAGFEPTDEGQQIPKFDALLDFFGDRYGSFRNFKKTLAKDPVGLAADLSTVISGAGLIKGSTVAAALKQASKAIDPVRAAIKAVSLLTKPVKESLAGILGITTGVGTETIRTAAIGGREFRSALRGGISESDVVQTAKNAIDKVREVRRVNYQRQLSKIGLSNKTLNLKPVQVKLDSLIKRFRIKPGENPGEWDFSRSSLDRTSWQPMADLINDVKGWGSQVDDLTPIGVDILKQRIDDFFTPSKNSQNFVLPLRNSVKKVLVKNVPGYEKLVGDYATASDQIQEIEKALSLGPRAGADTILRKLNRMMKESSEFRRQLVKDLEQATGTNIRELVAGAALKPVVPTNKLLPTIAGSAQVSAAAITGRPEILLLLPLGSPRLVGEFVNLVGRISKTTKEVASKVPVKTLFQAGRVEQQAPKQSDQPLGLPARLAVPIPQGNIRQ